MPPGTQQPSFCKGQKGPAFRDLLGARRRSHSTAWELRREHCGEHAAGVTGHTVVARSVLCTRATQSTQQNKEHRRREEALTALFLARMGAR